VGIIKKYREIMLESYLKQAVVVIFGIYQGQRNSGASHDEAVVFVMRKIRDKEILQDFPDHDEIVNGLKELGLYDDIYKIALFYAGAEELRRRGEFDPKKVFEWLKVVKIAKNVDEAGKALQAIIRLSLE